MRPISRREFTKKSTMAIGLIPFLNLPNKLFSAEDSNEKLSINIFSKHLQFLNYKELGEQTALMGFDGVDLTVRPKGHILPESVSVDSAKGNRRY